jgi:hypothetical protein
MKKLNRLKPVAAAVLAVSAAGLANAGEVIDFENGAKFDWRLTGTYSVSARTKDADPLLAGPLNAGANDGDNNFKKGALTANRLALLFESKLFKGDTGLVLSGSTFYDDVYHHTNDNDPSLSNPNRVNKPAPFNEFTSEAERYHGGYSRILDAYGYTTFGIGESSATVRLGRQVVNWGEAVFFPNIAMAQGPFDGTKAGIVGTETKDSVLPEDQIAASIEVTPRWSLLGHAQFGFHETIAQAPGAFLSTSDSTGPGASCLSFYLANGKCTFGTRGADIRPSNTGQWGIGTRYRVTNATELGLYYLNYNERAPVPEINAITGTYRIRYFDDVKLVGATASTSFGAVSGYAEVTYRDGAPVLVDAVVSPATGATIATATRAKVTQANLGGMWNIGRTSFADQVQLLAELSAVSVGSIEARQAIGSEAFPSAYGFVPSSNPSFRSKDGLAISSTLVLQYPGITESWDLNVPISYARQLSGRTLLGGVGGEGDTRYSIGAAFTRNGNLSISVTYLGYAGSASLDPTKNRLSTDRDQLSVAVKYTF